MSQDLRKKIISLHKKGEVYKKISKALLISQNTVAKVVQTFKKDGTATISQRRPGRPRNLTPRQERLLMRRIHGHRTLSPHTSYRWRGERCHRANSVDGDYWETIIDKGQRREFGQDTGVTPHSLRGVSWDF